MVSLVNARGLNAVQRAYLSAQAGTAGADAKAAESDAKSAGEKPAGDGTKGQAADELPFEEYEMEEPFVAKASRSAYCMAIAYTVLYSPAIVATNSRRPYLQLYGRASSLLQA